MLDNILMLDKIKALQISQLPKDEVEKLPEQHAAKTYRKQMSVLWAMKIVRKRCSWAMLREHISQQRERHLYEFASVRIFPTEREIRALVKQIYSDTVATAGEIRR